MLDTGDDTAAWKLERLQVAFEATGDGLWDYDLATGGLWLSPQLRAMVGGEQTGLVIDRQQVLDRIHPDDLAPLVAATRPVLKGDSQRFAQDVRLWHSGGYWVWVTMRGTVLVHEVDGTPARVVGTLKDINSRKQLEVQNDVLLRLSDVLLRQGDAGTLLQGALEVLGTYFRASRIAFADIDDDQGTMTIRHEWSDGTVRSVLGTWPLADYEKDKEAQVRRGECVTIPDILEDPRTNHPHILEAYEPYKVRAVMVLPMIRNGRFEAMLFLHSSTPRNWTADEIQLAEQARTRIWDAVIREQAEARLRESEKRLSSIFRLTPTKPWVSDPDGTPELLDDDWMALTGYPSGPGGPDAWIDALHPDDQEPVRTYLKACWTSGDPVDVRYRFKVDGQWRWFRAQGAPARDEQGAITRWYGFVADIHHQVVAELALRESEEKARATAELLTQIIETTADPVWAVGLDRRYIMVNTAAAEVMGLTPETMIGLHMSEVLPPDFIDIAMRQLDDVEKGAEFRLEELRYDAKKQEMRLFEHSKVPLRTADGTIRGSVGIAHDITDRGRAEDAIRQSELSARNTAMLLERILETTPAAVWVMDRDGRYMLINSAAARVTGTDRTETIGRSIEEVLPEAFAPQARAELERVLAGEEVAVEDRLFDNLLGEVRLFDSLKVPLRDADGAITGLVGVARDITERKAIELRLQAIVDTAGDAIVVIDETGRIASANPSTFTLFGYQEAEMVGRSIEMIMPREHADIHESYIGNYLRTGERRVIGTGRQVMGLRKNGTTFPLDLSIAEWFDTNGKRYFTGIMRDVTARLEAESRLRRAHDTLLSVSRLSAAGAMASTLAHELNQPLTASSNLLRSARRLLEREQETDKVPGLLAEAATEVLRAGSIIRRMREYTVNGELDPAPHRLADLAATALQMVQRRPEAQDVNVQWVLDPAVDKVMADPIQIEQVIANLLRNAIEAMDGDGERLIILQTEAEGDHAALHVHDSGHGIPAEQMDKLFQPFATTKDSGTGLGLAICRTIVEAHGGQIHANNRHGCTGATFTITLPVARKGRGRAAEASA